MFFISLNILKALIVSIDMEIQSKNLNLRLGDRLEKKATLFRIQSTATVFQGH